ncbi:MAG: hypothetical protein CXR30_16345 [Geobacter sp.]|nr:MAG: hypothetical protein CXR30_16345 [Geobacter sp.]
MNTDIQNKQIAAEELERRLTELARSKSRLELINRLLISLSSVAGLDNMVQHILDILLQTIGAANITIIFRLDDSWQLRDLFGVNRKICATDHPDIARILDANTPLRIHDAGSRVPCLGQNEDLALENWIFPLLAGDRKIGVICMDGMQLTDRNIFDELQPFFVYAGLMLDNEISSYAQLAEANRRLQESETLYRTLFEQSPDGVILFDIDELKPVQFNQAAHTLLGYSRAEYAALTVHEIHCSENTMAVDKILETLHQTGEISFEAEHRGKDGGLRSVHVSLKKFELVGRPMVLAIHRDMTERKQAAEERLKLERQLLHVQKLESLGVLAGGIAHDFNNILTAIIGNADLALMRLSNESPVVENLRRIEQAAVNASDLARQMLAYSGKGKFIVENMDLSRLLENMLHMLEVSISKKAILRLDLMPSLPPIEGDATQIRQIVMNLVINASEAIGDRSGVIAITTGCLDCDRSYLKDVLYEENLSDGLYVYLEIADTGCGMDRETVDKIFDPFFTTKFTGRGLGMAAVLGIVRGHRGAIKIYSEPGRGTTFKILLPASGKPGEIFNDAVPWHDWQGSGTVLFVDDEETVRGIGGEMLRELGFNVVTADNGLEAIRIFKETPDIAFVILDLTMPHLDGEQCFRELRQIRPDVKVIISSGYNEHEVTQKFVGKGLAGFIQKPYKLSVLKEAITPLISL